MSHNIDLLKKKIAQLTEDNTKEIAVLKEKIRKQEEYNKEYNRKYYLEKRKKQIQEKRKEEKKTQPPKIKTCEICGKEFEVQTGNAKYCSEECRKQARAISSMKVRQTESYKEWLKKYTQTEKYKETRRKYAQSSKGKKAMKKYFKKYKENGYKALGTQKENTLKSV